MKMKIVVFVVALFLFGCNSYKELKMPQKNLTYYEFNASVASIQDIIRKNYEKFPLRYIESAEDSLIVWGESILKMPENKNDFYIRDMVPVDTSQIYYSHGKSLPYFYEIHIHLKAIDAKKTLVEIRTIDPKIGIGVRFPYNILKNISVPDAAITEPVPPSTIEEYEILLVIGEALGVKEKMPPLILPERPSGN